MTDTLAVLCLNAGSSSLKVALDEVAAGDGGAEAPGARTRGSGSRRSPAAPERVERRHASASVERVGSEDARLAVRDASGRVVHQADVRGDGAGDGDRAAIHAAVGALAELASRAGVAVAAAGHRVVHGGAERAAPRLVDADLVEDLRRLADFAPLHQPAAIAGIEAIGERFPELPQVACFDTAFHRRMPEVAQRLPLPRRLWDEGVRRYGFHGLSYEWVVSEVGPRQLGRAVIAHLGSGASLAAVRDGLPVDTTMGFSPAGGIMMGTRPGDLDPGLLLYLLERRRLSPDALDRLVNHESGLLGVSGASADVRELLERCASDDAAARAVELFCWTVRKGIGAMAAALGGVDTLVFTGGIGEHAAPVRAEACAGLAHLGIRIDAARNAAHAPVISLPRSTCTVRVVAADEARMIARHTARVVASLAA